MTNEELEKLLGEHGIPVDEIKRRLVLYRLWNVAVFADRVVRRVVHEGRWQGGARVIDDLATALNALEPPLEVYACVGGIEDCQNMHRTHGPCESCCNVFKETERQAHELLEVAVREALAMPHDLVGRLAAAYHVSKLEYALNLLDRIPGRKRR